jgi:hypothetical protein
VVFEFRDGVLTKVCHGVAMLVENLHGVDGVDFDNSRQDTQTATCCFPGGYFVGGLEQKL